MYGPLAKYFILPSMLLSANAYRLIPIKLCHHSLKSYPYYPVLTTSKCLSNLIYFCCLYPGETRNTKGCLSFDESQIAILPLIAYTFHAKYRTCSRNLRTFFPYFGRWNSGCVKYANFFLLRFGSGFYSSIIENTVRFVNILL